MADYQNFLPQWMDTSIEIAQQSGAILRKYWGNVGKIQEKEFAGDLVTVADRESEEHIIQSIQKFFPSHQIWAEESGRGTQNGDSDFLWLIDPLDGTTNYAHHYPHVAISIALLYKGNPILGVIYNPILEELYLGAQNLGATLNGHPIKVSHTINLTNSLLATGFAYNRRETLDNNYAEFCYFTELTQGVRRGGSAALDLAYVAAGRLDGYWEPGLKPWDIAAGIIIVQEAGGRISNYDLQEIDLDSGRILATNGLLHKSLSQELLSLRESIQQKIKAKE